MGIPADLLDILACPLCREHPLKDADGFLECPNRKCNLRYPVKDGVPWMLIEEAERPCPGCGKSREWKDETLTCPGCGKSFRAPSP